MSYSEDYDWGHQKWKLVQELGFHLRQLLSIWKISAYTEELEDMES
jgi:hypothetical protein